MKHILLIILCLCSLASFSQTKYEARAAMKAEIATRNKDLPLTIGFFTINKIDIEGNNYVVYFVIDEEQQDFDSYVSNMKNNSDNLFSIVSSNRQEQTKLFVISELSIKFVIQSKQTQKTEVIFLPASKIKEAYTQTNYTAKDLLMDIVVDLRKDLPEDWGDGLVCTSIDVDNNYICYRIKTDETFITMPLLRRSQEEGNDVIESIIEEFNSTDDPMENLFIMYLKQSGMGMKYIYWSEKSAENVTFTITPSMIRTYIKN